MRTPRRNARPITLPDGRTFESTGACARALGLDITTVCSARRRGTLANIGSGSGSKRHPLRCGDQEFRTIRDAAKFVGYSPTVLSRLRRQALARDETTFVLEGLAFEIVQVKHADKPSCTKP